MSNVVSARQRCQHKSLRRKDLLKNVAASSAALALFTCSQVDAKPDVCVGLRDVVREQSKGFLRVVACQKTNGTEFTTPVHAYQIEYTAQVEAVEDVDWANDPSRRWDGLYCVTRADDARRPEKVVKFWGGVRLKKDARIGFAGALTYTLTDNGWRLQTARCR